MFADIQTSWIEKENIILYALILYRKGGPFQDKKQKRYSVKYIVSNYNQHYWDITIYCQTFSVNDLNMSLLIIVNNLVTETMSSSLQIIFYNGSRSGDTL